MFVVAYSCGITLLGRLEISNQIHTISIYWSERRRFKDTNTPVIQ